MGIAAKHSSIRKLKSRFMVKSFRFAGLLRNLVVEGAFVRTAPPNQSRGDAGVALRLQVGIPRCNTTHVTGREPWRLCKAAHIGRNRLGSALTRRFLQKDCRGQGKAYGSGNAARVDGSSRGGIEWQVNCGTPAYVELLCRLVARRAMPPRNFAAAPSHGRLNFVLAVSLARGTRIPTLGVSCSPTQPRRGSAGPSYSTAVPGAGLLRRRRRP